MDTLDLHKRRPKEPLKEKVVILGGVHGDDKLGVEVLTHYFSHSNPIFQLMLGNYKAVEEGKKFIDFDMLKAGEGDITCTTSIEKCRAAEMHEVLEQFEYVVDVHGSHVNDDCAVVFNDDEETLKFAAALGVKKVILAEKNNYLIESVPHAVTLIKKVEAKPDPTRSEVTDTVLMLNRVEEYLNDNLQVDKPEVFILEGGHENVIDFIKQTPAEDVIKKKK